MENFLNDIYNYIINLINSSVTFGPIFACLLIFLESIIPVLPLFVFITIIFVAYGYGFGFIISYILTCMGCFFSFFLWRKLLRKFFQKRIKSIKNLEMIMSKIDTSKLQHLALIMAIPFTPAFLINIAAGLSNINFKKFFVATLIGKISLIAFWGFIGTSLLESLKNPKIIVIIIFMLLGAYLLSRIVNYKLKIK